jgi:hypothetical protein
VARGLLNPFPSTSAAAEEGTLAHAVLEAVVKCGDLPEGYTEEMIRSAANFTRLLDDEGIEYTSEEKVDPAKHPALAGFPPGIFKGTADINFRNGVADYKFGRKEVSVLSLQMALYAASKHPQDQYRVGVYQPRVNHEQIIWHTYTAEEMDSILTTFADRARLALRNIELQQLGYIPKIEEFNSGEHCKFCRGLVGCPAHLGDLIEASTNEFYPVDKALDLADTISDWSSALKAKAFNMLTLGISIEGWDLAPGRASKREWTSLAVLAETIEEDLVGDLAALKREVIVTPAEAKKILGEVPDILAALMTEPVRNLTLKRKR